MLHDRAPLFVKVRDGSIRNAYTLKVSNKTPDPAVFSLAISGVPGAGMTVADDAEHRQQQLNLDVARDAIGTFRVLVYGTPTKLVDGSQQITFTLRNTTTGETKDVTSVFMGPAR